MDELRAEAEGLAQLVEMLPDLTDAFYKLRAKLQTEPLIDDFDRFWLKSQAIIW